MVDISNRTDINKIALAYASILKREFSLEGLYLYGSYAKGNFHQDSDIDLAVISCDFSGDVIDDTFKLMKLRRLVDNRIEPHPFLTKEFTDDNPLAREVMRTGIQLI
jgi:predicted nucleotidyltransferase